MWLKVGGSSLWAAHKGQKVGGPRPARPNSFRRQCLNHIVTAVNAHKCTYHEIPRPWKYEVTAVPNTSVYHTHTELQEIQRLVNICGRQVIHRGTLVNRWEMDSPWCVRRIASPRMLDTSMHWPQQSNTIKTIYSIIKYATNSSFT